MKTVEDFTPKQRDPYDERYMQANSPLIRRDLSSTGSINYKTGEFDLVADPSRPVRPVLVPRNTWI